MLFLTLTNNYHTAHMRRLKNQVKCIFIFNYNDDIYDILLNFGDRMTMTSKKKKLRCSHQIGQ